MDKVSKILKFYLGVMGSLILFGLLFPKPFKALFSHPEAHLYAKFCHVLSVTLVFANAVIGTLWETRGLLSRRAEIIRYTYQMVTWMDSMFTAPLIVVSVISGILMATNLGGVWSIGWISLAFVIFLVSGFFWVALDIPTQYRVNQLFKQLNDNIEVIPSQITRLLWFRLGVNFCSLIPLLLIFFLMIVKPDIQPIQDWFHRP